MKNFTCAACGNTVYFENTTCLTCKALLGFLPTEQTMVTLQPLSPDLFARHGGHGQPLKYCDNARHGVCNWLTSPDDPNGLCSACDLNRTIPNLAEPGSLPAWRELERAKKRLIYSLLRFGLPLDASAWGKGRLTFDFMRKAMTGHQDGVITVDIKEADSVERERERLRFDEPYRSLLGHLRHESGHFYWMLLVEAAGRIDEFRTLFGDERRDYGAALGEHHANGAPPDWHSRHVSAYASAHPWEDWAESWAHYLHMVDAVETAEASGMEPRSAGFAFGSLWPFKAYDNYREESFQALMARWIPLTLSLNSLMRSMGHPDFYPFVIPVAAHDKLDFIHRVIRGGVLPPAPQP